MQKEMGLNSEDSLVAMIKVKNHEDVTEAAVIC